MDFAKILYYIGIGLLIILLSITIGLSCYAISYKSNYKCITIDNEEINCIRVITHRGYITGEDENGKVYMIKSYQEIK